jgi:hypothetical protein
MTASFGLAIFMVVLHNHEPIADGVYGEIAAVWSDQFPGGSFTPVDQRLSRRTEK